MRLFEEDTSLKQMNHILVDVIPKYTLLGDLAISQEDFIQLANRISRFYQEGAITQLAVLYKESVAVFLVFNAVYEYDARLYWGPVEARLGELSPYERKKFFAIFNEVLDKYHLNRFTQQSEEGYAYVTPILCHAGIPQSAYEGYFDALRNTLNDGFYEEFTLEEYLYYFKNKTERTIRRFLELKDRKEAYVFIQQTRNAINGETLVEEGIKGNHLRMIETVNKWKENPKVKKSLSVRSNVRIMAPKMKLAIDGVGIYCILPQIAVKSCYDSYLVWEICYEDEEYIVKTDLFSKRGQFISEEKEYILKPSSLYTIALKLDDQVISKWEIDGIQNGYMAFNEQGNKIKGGTLPNRVVTLILDKKESIRNTHMLPIVTLPNIPKWHGYNVYKIDLSNSESLKCSFGAIYIDKDYTPTLEGGESLQGHEHSQVYFKLPYIRFPEMYQGKWQVDVVKYKDQEIIEKVMKVIDEYTSTLLLSSVIEGEAYGSYQVKISPVTGRNFRYELDYVPPIYLKSCGGYWPSEYSAYTSDIYEMRMMQNVKVIPYNGEKIREKHSENEVIHYYRIKKNERYFIGDYSYEDRQNTYTTSIVESIRPISWGITGVEHYTVEYTNKVYRLTIKELMDAADPSLYMMFNFGERDRIEKLHFSIRDKNKCPIMKQSFCVESKEGLRIELNKFLFNLQEQDMMEYYFYIGLEDSMQNEITSFVVAKIQSEVYIENCCCNIVDDQTIIKWDEEGAKLERECVLVNLTAPWKQPVYIPIEDGIQEVSIIPKDLIRGFYRYSIRKVKDNLFFDEAEDEICTVRALQKGVIEGKGDEAEETPLQRLLIELLKTRWMKREKAEITLKRLEKSLASITEIVKSDILAVSYAYIVNIRFGSNKDYPNEVKRIFKALFLKFWLLREEVLTTLLESEIPRKYKEHLIYQFYCHTIISFSGMNSLEKKVLMDVDETFAGLVQIIERQEKGLTWLGVSDINDLKKNGCIDFDKTLGNPQYITQYFEYVYEAILHPKNIQKTADTFLHDFVQKVEVEELPLLGKTRLGLFVEWQEQHKNTDVLKQQMAKVLKVTYSSAVKKQYEDVFNALNKRRDIDEIGYYIGQLALYMTFVRHQIISENRDISRFVSYAIKNGKKLYYRDAAILEIYMQQERGLKWD